MKTMTEITSIITNMNDKDFEALVKASLDSDLETGKIRYKARAKFRYLLCKYNLTEAEYILWEIK